MDHKVGDARRDIACQSVVGNVEIPEGWHGKVWKITREKILANVEVCNVLHKIKGRKDSRESCEGNSATGKEVRYSKLKNNRNLKNQIAGLTISVQIDMTESNRASKKLKTTRKVVIR